MKIIKQIISILILTVIFSNITVFAETQSNLTKCIDKEGYDLYKCQVSNICLKEEYWVNTNKIVSIDKFYEEDISNSKIKNWINFTKSNINKAKALYRENQNKIYKCSIINSQIIVFEDIKKTLNYTDKTWILKERIIKKLDIKREKLEQISGKECIVMKKSVNSKELIKKVVLDQSTLELCSYSYYLNYLDDRATNDLSDSFPEWKKSISSSSISKIISEKQFEIDKERQHSLKLYPMAFNTYIQYDSFLKIHIVLELLKEDYRVFRDKLYLTLHPINQVVYKIINAQSR